MKKPLNLNGTVLAKIYTGKITKWNDPAIAALNKGVSLPAIPIVTLHRADSSGTTFLFTSYLNAQDPADWPPRRSAPRSRGRPCPARWPRPAAAAW